MWVVLTSGLLLAALIWGWPHVPSGLRYLYFFGAFVAYYTIATGFAYLSRAADARAKRRTRY